VNKSRQIMPYVVDIVPILKYSSEHFRIQTSCSIISTKLVVCTQTALTAWLNTSKNSISEHMDNREQAPSPESQLEDLWSNSAATQETESTPTVNVLVDFLTDNTGNGRQTPQLSSSLFMVPTTDDLTNESTSDQEMTEQDVFLPEELPYLENEYPLVGLDEADTTPQVILYTSNGGGSNEDLFSLMDEDEDYPELSSNFTAQRAGASSSFGTTGSSILDPGSEATGSLQEQTSSVGSLSEAPREAAQSTENRTIKNCFPTRQEMMQQMAADINRYDARREREFGLGALDPKSVEKPHRIRKRQRSEESEMTPIERAPRTRRNAVDRGNVSRLSERDHSPR
jgi:hypothetical protein